MPIPESSNYPEALDTDDNLFLVHDALRVLLVEDYDPGDTSITVEGDDDGVIMDTFPDTGLITLTEQQSDIDERAITLYYNSKTDTTFDGLILLPGFDDVVKPKNITNVTQNVMAQHHNAIKDALIAIQEFVGIEGETALTPGGDTIQARLNFLKKIVFTPKAWFSVDKRVGLVPLCVTFTDQSFNVGNGECGSGEVIYIWHFGDESSSTISCVSSAISVPSVPSTPSVPSVPGVRTICVTSTVPLDDRNVLVRDLDGETVQKCYTTPGFYTPTLIVINAYGQDTVIFPDIINARIEAPDEAVIDYSPQGIQSVTPGVPSGGPYTTPPIIRSPTDTFIDLGIPSGENPNTPGRSYGGELLDGCGDPIDPILTYTWDIADDLEHASQPSTRASFSIGGRYNLSLRVDTRYGSYRITNYEQTFDIVEEENLWLWNFNSPNVRAHEFGLSSETFKTAAQNLAISRDDSFLDYLANPPYYEDAEARAKREFARNTAFSRKGTTPSGLSGNAMMFWARGGSDVENQRITVKEYNGFSDTYEAKSPIKGKPWNWASLISPDDAYFLFGTQEYSTPSGTNKANPVKTTYSLSSQTYTNATLTTADFTNGAEILLDHPSEYDGGIPTNGYFATYRSTWKGQVGYLLRNSAVNEFFRLEQFFSTQGTALDPFQTMTTLPSLSGTSAKVEGQLVTLSNGIYFFNNSGEILAYNESTGVWEVGSPSLQSVSFRSLQDTEVSGFDNPANTLLAASDEDSVVYLSYDYSPNAFIKYNSTDLTFNSAGSRPAGNQFLMGIY
jgi:PKD repeat protein